jgi:hypothetical protein
MPLVAVLFQGYPGFAGSITSRYDPPFYYCHYRGGSYLLVGKQKKSFLSIPFSSPRYYFFRCPKEVTKGGFWGTGGCPVRRHTPSSHALRAAPPHRKMHFCHFPDCVLSRESVQTPKALRLAPGPPLSQIQTCPMTPAFRPQRSAEVQFLKSLQDQRRDILTGDVYHLENTFL